MDQLEIRLKIEDPEERKTIDDYFNFDLKKKLEEEEYYLEGFWMAIVMEPNDKESPNLLKQTFEFKLAVDEEEKQEEQTLKIQVEEEPEVLITQGEEETNPQKEHCQSNENLIKLIERIEYYHQEYDNMVDRVLEKVQELRKQYSKEDYKFTYFEGNKHSGTFADKYSDEKQHEEDSKISSDSSAKRKKSLEEESEPKTDQKSESESTIKYPFSESPDSKTLIIGPRGTQINRKEFESLQWKDAAGATRGLCNVIFGERTLATHSLTGNQSPAFRGRERPIKAQLDSDKTGDITDFICTKFNVTQQLVRATITTKCADAAKKIRRIKLKKNSKKL